jgi:hypothetical protein
LITVKRGSYISTVSVVRGDIESWSLVWTEGGGVIDAANKLAPDIDLRIEEIPLAAGSPS